MWGLDNFFHPVPLRISNGTALYGLKVLCSMTHDNYHFRSALVSFSLCKVESFFFTLSSLGNVYSYVLMTVDRFIFIQKPLRYYDILTQKVSITSRVVRKISNRRLNGRR